MDTRWARASQEEREGSGCEGRAGWRWAGLGQAPLTPLAEDKEAGGGLHLGSGLAQLMGRLARDWLDELHAWPQAHCSVQAMGWCCTRSPRRIAQ